MEDPYIGTTLLGQFQIEELIGVGGMGAVYRARQQNLDRDVAVKILHGELAGNEDVLRRFRREAKVTTKLDHPNVVDVLLFGALPEGSPYLVMEYLQGESLGVLLGRQGSFPLQQALHIGVQIADGIGAAHMQHVVHRDVKPENVLIVHRQDDPNFVKVVDFGIARLLRSQGTVQTQSGLIFGTARYISPEAAAGDPADARSDVYSIGVVLYALLTGAPPFDAATPVALLMKHVQEPPPPMLQKGTAVPAPVEEVVMRCLRKSPAERFEDAVELASALRQAAVAAGVELLAPTRAASALPAPRRSAAAMGAHTEAVLAAAPNPYAGPAKTRDLERSALLQWVATIAFVLTLGAGAVISGAWLAGFLDSSESSAESRAETVVADFTEPTQTPNVATEPEQPEPTLQVVPSSPHRRQAVTLIGVLGRDQAIPPGVIPVFRVWREERRIRGDVPAHRGPVGHTWLASYVFPRGGRYEVRLEYGNGPEHVVLVGMTIVVAVTAR
ncbi:MAG: protein kinase, partial [Myxococcota bacterium]